MFFSLILENAVGDQIDMTATANQYMTSKIEGLSPPNTNNLSVICIYREKNQIEYLGQKTLR